MLLDADAVVTAGAKGTYIHRVFAVLAGGAASAQTYVEFGVGADYTLGRVLTGVDQAGVDGLLALGALEVN